MGYENLVGQFNKLMQKGRVEVYITQFDELRSYVMAQEGHLRESYCVDTFISGLKEELSQALYNHRPATLQEARNMARGQVFLLDVLDKRYKGIMKHSAVLVSKQGFSSYKSFSPASKVDDKSMIGGESRKLSFAEITEKKKKGLCFHCDEKFTPGHACKKKKLYVILVEE